MRLLRPPWLCVRWAAEGWRVEINVKFKEPAVYVWGEMKVGEAPALGLWTGLSRCMCVCVYTCIQVGLLGEPRWNSEASFI